MITVCFITEFEGKFYLELPEYLSDSHNWTVAYGTNTSMYEPLSLPDGVKVRKFADLDIEAIKKHLAIALENSKTIENKKCCPQWEYKILKEMKIINNLI